MNQEMFANLHARVVELFGAHLSKQLAFRPMHRSDAFALWTATRHPDFNRYLLWDAPTEEADLVVQVDKLIREHGLLRLVALSLTDKVTGGWRGFLLLKPFKEGFEMSLYLHPDTWNTGLVLTSGCAVIELLVRTWPELPVFNRVHVENRRMLRLVRHYGFEHVGHDSLTHARGHAVEVEVYRLRLSQWKGWNELSMF